MAIEQHHVESLDQFVNSVGDIRHKWTKADGRFFNPWFRGQINASWGLARVSTEIKISRGVKQI
jgi:hypothetical protein